MFLFLFLKLFQIKRRDSAYVRGERSEAGVAAAATYVTTKNRLSKPSVSFGGDVGGPRAQVGAREVVVQKEVVIQKEVVVVDNSAALLELQTRLLREIDHVRLNQSSAEMRAEATAEQLEAARLELETLRSRLRTVEATAEDDARARAAVKPIPEDEGFVTQLINSVGSITGSMFSAFS